MKLVSGGTDLLFEQYSIQQIQEIEQNIRADIEMKKEDLRQMVGERYRDLIEAADTIAKMKQTSESVKSYVALLTEQCRDLQQACQSKAARASPLAACPEHWALAHHYAILAQVKLLVDLPSKIWAEVERGGWVRASCCLLVAQQTHVQLDLGARTAQRGALRPWRTLVARQGASLASFHQSILQNCWKNLLSLELSAELALECLCGVSLLEGSTPSEILAKFFRKRLGLVESIFSSEEHGSSTREQMTQLATLLLTSLELVQRLFLPSNSQSRDRQGRPPSLVEAKLLLASQSDVSDLVNFAESPSFRYLPQAIREYRIGANVQEGGLPTEHIQRECRDFVSKLEGSSGPHVVSRLRNLQGLRALAQVCSSVRNILGQEGPSSKACVGALGAELSSKERFFGAKFADRIKEIMTAQLEGAMTACLDTLVSTRAKSRETRTSPLDRECDAFTWSESPVDASLFGGRDTTKGPGSLTMKTRGLSPQVQAICLCLDKQLEALLGELECFPAEHRDPDTWALVEDHLAGAATAILNRWLSFVEEEKTSSPGEADWLALLGQVCHGLGELCPALERCFPAVPKKASSAAKDLVSWQKQKMALSEHRDAAYRAGTVVIVRKEAARFREQMTSGSVDDVMASLLTWSEVKIQEETEGGSTVQSTLRVPLQVTVALQELLFSVCQEVNRVFGHSLSRAAQAEVSRSLLIELEPTYVLSARAVSSRSPASLSQNWALQLLLDLSVLSQLLQGDVGVTWSALESYVDPFDLDVVVPHLEKHATLAAQQASLLLGLCLSPQRFVCERPLPPRSTGAVLGHNVLPLHSVAGRFPLLPTLSRFLEQPDSRSTGSPDQPPKSSSGPDLSKMAPSLTASQSTPVLNASPSFYEKMATTMRSSWFGAQ
ncbi:hypothetical protein HPB47_000629 [Ixodes persulcatus]|uniref:Uncharacterized protein n=1 Tax=Ixodes persulcatus TaxID=34615 RepID=A0AC60PR61_IXOPE|nr:hypothetical protein HPB47_000629 [Ixodes persulcatus]